MLKRILILTAIVTAMSTAELAMAQSGSRGGSTFGSGSRSYAPAPSQSYGAPSYSNQSYGSPTYQSPGYARGATYGGGCGSNSHAAMSYAPIQSGYGPSSCSSHTPQFSQYSAPSCSGNSYTGTSYGAPSHYTGAMSQSYPSITTSHSYSSQQPVSQCQGGNCRIPAASTYSVPKYDNGETGYGSEPAHILPPPSQQHPAPAVQHEVPPRPDGSASLTRPVMRVVRASASMPRTRSTEPFKAD